MYISEMEQLMEQLRHKINQTCYAMESIYSQHQYAILDKYIRVGWPGSTWLDAGKYTLVRCSIDIRGREVMYNRFPLQQAPMFWSAIPILTNIFKASDGKWTETQFSENTMDAKRKRHMVCRYSRPYMVGITGYDDEDDRDFEIRYCMNEEWVNTMTLQDDSLKRCLENQLSKEGDLRFHVGVWNVNHNNLNANKIDITDCDTLDEFISKICEVEKDGLSPLIMQYTLDDDNNGAICFWLTNWVGINDMVE